MAQYIVQAKSFIDNAIREIGDIVEYDGVPHKNLKAVDGTANPVVDSKTEILRRQMAAAGVDSADLDEAVQAKIAADAKEAEDKTAAVVAQNAAIGQAVADAMLKNGTTDPEEIAKAAKAAADATGENLV